MRNSRAALNTHGQALLEFAIAGFLALLALGFLIQVGLQVNYQQEIEQQTFRRALAKADSFSVIEPAAVQYLQFRDRQLPDPLEGFGIMPRTLTQADATVVWGTFLGFTDADDRRSQPLTVVRVNNVEREFADEDFDGFPEDAPTISRITRGLTSTGTLQQAGSGSGTPTSSSSTTTTQTTQVTLKNDATVSSTLTKTTAHRW